METLESRAEEKPSGPKAVAFDSNPVGAIPKRVSYVPWDPSGIPLNFLIHTHKQHSYRQALPENLGDGYLYKENPVYRSIRDEYLRRGFRFTTQDFCHAFSFPLMALDDFIEAGMVPYYNNFHWIETMQRIAPGKMTCSEVRRFDLKRNYLLHESAHLIAHDVFFGKEGLREVPKDEAALLRILLGEAFANTTEAISSIFAKNTFGAFFLSMNSYFLVRGEALSELERFVEKHGFATTAKVLMGGFLYANFLYTRLEEEELSAVRRLAGLGPRASIDVLMKIALSLSMGFRLSTTPLHLLKIGFDPDIARLMERDPVRRLLERQKQSLLREAEELVAMLGRFVGQD